MTVREFASPAAIDLTSTFPHRYELGFAVSEALPDALRVLLVERHPGVEIAERPDGITHVTFPYDHEDDEEKVQAAIRATLDLYRDGER